MLKSKTLFLCLTAVLVAGFALGSQAIPNWSAPATWSPARSGGVHTMADVTNALPFVGVTPCRVADTRGNGFVGAYGPPSLVANANRTFVIVGQCGIPTGAAAVSFNFGALNVGGNGDLRVFPAGGGLPLVSTMNYNAFTPNIANAAIVPLGGGGITVRADAVPVDLIIDVNGYYPDGASTLLLNPGLHFEVAGNSVPPFGILNGRNNSTAVNARGILGISDDVSVNSVTWTHAAIRGEAFSGNGVIGLTNQGGSCGMIGVRYDTAGVEQTAFLGGCTHGLDYRGGLSGTGTKNFVEPHPTDATKLIRYTSLEGPEAGTYFRGTATTVDGFAVITVPETFRWVTDPEGLTVQLTPTGREFALMRVESADLNAIFVRSSVESTTFHFMVNGVRRAYKDMDVIVDNYLLKPSGPADVMPNSLSPLEKARLIQNGTYNPDGTVNLNTAERVGWAQAWRDRDEEARLSAAKPVVLSPDRP